MRIKLTAIATTLAIAALAGCGSGGGSSSSSSSAPTKQEFVAKADRICQQGNKEINAAAHKVFSPQGPRPSPAQIQQFSTQTVIPSITKQVDGIAALTPPTGDVGQVNAILDAVRQAVDQAKKNPAVLTQKGAGPFAKANMLATQYGLKVCGRG